MENETTEINNSEDVIDSRDIEERIKYLETELEKEDELYTGEHDELKTELAKLTTLKEDIDNKEEWEFGITLINETYFEDYAREEAKDLGAIKDDFGWPANHINWEAAAEELLIDYTSVEFDGVTYYYR